MKDKVTFAAVNTREEISMVAKLAGIIWKEHYTPIIKKAQVEYMLEHFQSQKAISRQVVDKVNYFLINKGSTSVGYLAIQNRGRELFLSKIYLLREYRGMGMGKSAMEFIVEKAGEFGCDQIVLTVNKNNDRSIKAYSKMGFENQGPQVTDIGGGFIMDDYLMINFLRNNSSESTGSSPI